MLAMVVSLFIFGLSACTSHSIAPVGRNPFPETDYHTVQKGENVYSIALRYGLDYHELATWNRITSPSFRIFPGQKIRLSGHSRGPYKPIKRSNQSRTRVRKTPASETLVLTKKPLPPPSKASEPLKVSHAPKPIRNLRKNNATGNNTEIKKQTTNRTRKTVRKGKGGTITKWHWPSKGKLIHNFGQSGNRGLDISGKFGSPIYAVADGKVVYTGSGLRGYGKLIIIKHNRHYLSAYANNDRMLVKEGVDVSGGQKIAEMGRSSSHLAMLHFEIRKNGKPVNPIKYLKGR